MGRGALALTILMRGEADREQPHESFRSFLFLFPPQKVLIYEVPQAHLDHLGLQVSISGHWKVGNCGGHGT